MLKRTLPNRTQRILGVSAIAIVAAGVCAAAWAAQPAQVVLAKSSNIARADAAPFIEPPVADRSMLAGAPRTEEGWQLAQADHAAQDDYAKTAARDDENADDPSDESDDANVNADDNDNANASDSNDDASEGDAVIINGDHVSRRHLTAEERAQIRAAVAQARAAAAQARGAARVAQSQAVREAMAQSRAAMAEARTAAREAQAEGMRAAREAQAEAVRSAVAAAREVNSPEMQAEIRAVAAQAAQLAHDTRMTEAQREQMRTQLRAHADRLRELARSHRDCPQSHDENASHDD